MKIYDFQTVKEATLQYFNNDDLATNVWMTKYALKDKNGDYVEKTPDDMHRRLAKEFARIEKKYINPMSEEEVYELFKGFKRIVVQGSPMSAIGNPYKLQSAGNCFVIPPPLDSYGGILKADQELVQLMKRRAGVGVSLDNIRPKGVITNNAAITSDGIGIFMERFSNSCREVAQNNRRGALLECISIHHPDIETFINIKKELTKVVGANVSVKITDEFMKAVKNNESYQVKFPINSDKPILQKTLDAKNIWNQIVDAAWKSGEPGILFFDNIINNSIPDIYGQRHDSFNTTATNPCGELPIGVDSCRLTLLNLMGYVDNPFKENSSFNYNRFGEDVIKAQRLMDDLVDLELEIIDKILNKIKSDPEPESVKKVEYDLWKEFYKSCQQGRRTGLGITAIGDVLAALNLKYGSKESINVVEEIYKTLAINAHYSSCILAKERGPFPIFDLSLEENSSCPYLKRIWNENDKKIYELTKKYGRRNIALTTTAPAGSVSCLTQTTSGIEPVYLLKYTRRRKINSEDKNIRVDFVDNVGDCWQEYEVIHHGLKKWMETTGTTDIEKSPYWKSTSNDIDWEASIELQAKAQKWVSHSISKTCNVPKNTTKETISNIYMKAWESGCKGITVYRDGSRSGVLVSTAQFPQTNAPVRPNVLDCGIHHITIKGEKWTILIGLMEGKPYECLGGLATRVEIPKKYTRAKLQKNKFKTKNNTYDLIIGENGSEFKIKDVVDLFDNPDYAVFTRMISLGLRHGAGINYIVEQLQKDKDADLFSFSKCIARVLKTYIEDGTKVCSGEKYCPECKTDSLVYKEGCVLCNSCGYSKCG